MKTIKGTPLILLIVFLFSFSLTIKIEAQTEVQTEVQETEKLDYFIAILKSKNSSQKFLEEFNRYLLENPYTQAPLFQQKNSLYLLDYALDYRAELVPHIMPHFTIEQLFEKDGSVDSIFRKVLITYNAWLPYFLDFAFLSIEKQVSHKTSFSNMIVNEAMSKISSILILKKTLTKVFLT
jgi:hypothetical protein